MIYWGCLIWTREEIRLTNKWLVMMIINCSRCIMITAYSQWMIIIPEYRYHWLYNSGICWQALQKWLPDLKNDTLLEMVETASSLYIYTYTYTYIYICIYLYLYTHICCWPFHKGKYIQGVQGQCFFLGFFGWFCFQISACPIWGLELAQKYKLYTGWWFQPVWKIWVCQWVSDDIPYMIHGK